MIIRKPFAPQVSALCALSVGSGDTIGGVAPHMTLTDSAGSFTADMVGRYVHITDATANGNNGTFLVTAYTSVTEITYTNPAGFAEAFGGDVDVQR